MEQVSQHNLDLDTVAHTFYRHGLRRRLTLRLAGLLRAIWVGGLCVLTMLMVDAGWPLAGGVRLVIGIGVLLAWGVAVWRLRPIRPDIHQEALRNARSAERHYGLEGNPLVNALWLARQTGCDDDLPAVLARRSVAKGWHTLESISLNALIDSKPLRRAGVGVAVLIIVGFIILWLVPGFLAGGLARFANPFGDHPPFSFTQFSVTVDPSQVHVHDDVAVRVELTGRVPDHAILAQVDRQGNVLQRWPMRRLRQDRFERRLVSIDEPISFWVEADAGRSHRVDIVPAQRLQTANTGAESDTLGQPNNVVGDEADSSVANDVNADRHAAMRLDELINAAKRLQEYANELLGRVGQLDQKDRQVLDSVLTRLEHLNERLEGFERRSRVLADSLRGRIDSTEDDRLDDSLAESLRNLADRLERMKLSRVKRYDVSSVGHGVGEGRQGTVSLDPSDLVDWLGRLGKAASQDLIQLGSGQTILRQALAQAIGVAGMGQSTASGQEPQARQGGYDEIMSGDSAVVVPTDAVMQSVPGAYRHLVALYFERLLRDQSDR